MLAIALGVAFGAAELFGVSFALGAFFAGMVLSESELSQRAAQESLPLRDAFAVLFFVSVGMLFDPTILVARAAAGARDAAHHRDRQVARGASASCALFGHPHATGADDLGEPGADRRVLVHPRRLGVGLALLPERAAT